MVAILPIVIPVYEFTFRFETLMAGFEEALVLASVTEITRTTDHYEIRTHSTGSFAADNVVVATPIEVASLLLDLGEIKEPHSRPHVPSSGNPAPTMGSGRLQPVP
jgi:hypothetical protein